MQRRAAAIPFSELHQHAETLEQRAALEDAADVHDLVREGKIAEIGHRMGITTTAEGVETAEQLRNVYAAGYTEAQGYLIARPMPAENVRRLLGDEEGDSMPLAPLRIAG